MRERERQAEERRQMRKERFEILKESISDAFAEPTLKRELEMSLTFPNLDPEKRKAIFDKMVERNAFICLYGESEYSISPEYQCHAFIEMIDHISHARPALELAVALYQQMDKPMPDVLKQWWDNPGDSPPKKRGPRPELQDWTAMRDQIIGMVILYTVGVQNHPEWGEKLPIGRAYSSGEAESWRNTYSIFRAVFEVLYDRYGSIQGYHTPTYDMVSNAWRRYEKEFKKSSNSRPGRSLLPPKGLDSLIRPDGIDTKAMQQRFLEISDDYYRRRIGSGSVDND